MKKLIIIGAGAAAAALLLYNASASNDTGEEDQTGGIKAMFNDVVQPDGTISDQNVMAFLYMIRVGEGTADAGGYNRLMGGGSFSDMSDHPANLGWRGTPLSDAQCAGAGRSPGCVSTAAGAYQFIKPTWNSLKNKLDLPDFSTISQDMAAVELIRQKGALGDVKSGDIPAAIQACAPIWASFAGAGYGQHEVALNAMLLNFQTAGGVLA